MRYPAAGAALIALAFASAFRAALPIPQGWVSLESFWFPISALDLVFHEAGHWIFGLLGLPFLTVAGGTLMQLALPAACLVHFLTRRSWPGVLAMVWWLGENLVGISYYAADAKTQVIPLITGMSGSEGGGHDWGYMLGALGLKSSCVGLGQTLFFLGCWAMALPLLASGATAWRRWMRTS